MLAKRLVGKKLSQNDIFVSSLVLNLDSVNQTDVLSFLPSVEASKDTRRTGAN